MAVGRVAWTEVDVAINQDLKALLASPALRPRFLFHFMVANRVWLESKGIGTTVNGIPLNVVRQLPLRLPPLAEQDVIADVLDAIDEAIERTEAVIAATESLRQALLHELLTRGVSGWHTEWRDVPSLGTVPACWEALTLSDCMNEGPTNGLYKPETEHGAGVILIRILDFDSGRMLRLSGFDRVRATMEETARYAVQAGDILVNRVNSGDKVGKAVLFPDIGEAAVFESNMMRLRVNDPSTARFLEFHLASRCARAHFRARTKKAVQQASINQDDVLSVPVGIPPLAERVAIATLVDSVQQLEDRTVRELAALQATKAAVADSLLSGETHLASGPAR